MADGRRWRAFPPGSLIGVDGDGGEVPVDISAAGRWEPVMYEGELVIYNGDCVLYFVED